VVRRTNAHRRLSLPSYRPCRAYIKRAGTIGRPSIYDVTWAVNYHPLKQVACP
jgi:hypothetical protein